MRDSVDPDLKGLYTESYHFIEPQTASGSIQNHFFLKYLKCNRQISSFCSA